ncbi:LysR family transcriptional regulator [Novosphingobium sp. SG751A]|uniref:LysR family transcriptional regulator n=1 Tax=Novosphingobium sp. SG751A TaxID=2587000 RepID=UPI00352FF378
MTFLETFYWLGTLKSVKETAARMRIAQPVVSMRMAALQRSLGVELYKTNGRRIELTPMGQRVLRKCEAIVPLATELQEEVRQGEKDRIVRVGVTDVVGMSWLPAFLMHQRDHHPDVTLSIITGIYIKLVEAVRREEVDVAFVIGPIEDPTLSSVDLCDYAIRWVGSPTLVEGRIPTNVVELARFPIVQTPVTSYGYQQLLDYFRWHNVSTLEGLSPKQWVDVGFGTMVCAHFAREGAGVTALPVALVADQLRSGQLVELPVKQEVPAWELIALYRRQNESDVISKVVDSAKAAVARYAETADERHFR